MQFAIGHKVVFKADPELVGVVTSVDDRGPERRYMVFVNGEDIPAYESQLVLAEGATPDLIPSTLEGLNALLTSTQLTQPGMSLLYSLNAGRIDFIPYQFRPVLKLIRSDRPRLLIADEVGVGKTIEAGLILRELRARQKVDSVLVVCPKSLVTERKWEDELWRFGEGFETLDGVSLRRCLVEMDLEGEWPERFSRSILPSSLFSENLLNGFEGKGRRAPVKGLTQLEPPPGFDLLILDEAHHLRNPETYLHQGIRILAERSHTVLFLTATPINLGDQDLFQLLNILRPDLIIDRETFQRIAEPNPHINAACEAARVGDAGWEERCVEALSAVEVTEWGRNVTTSDPRFKASRSSLDKAPLGRKERVRLIQELEELHTLSGVISRTRRRDIGEFTVRKSETVEIDFTDEQRALHDRVLETQARILSRLHDRVPIGFLMSTIQRQMASCPHGLAPFIRHILSRRLSELELDELGAEDLEASHLPLDDITSEIDEIASLAERLPPEDPKLNALIQVLRSKKKEPRNKVLVFSTFLHTLRYLHDRLSEAGFRVGLVHGDISQHDRWPLRRRFRLDRSDPDSFDVLLSSEVGSEGLDYQFCDCLVNYDLPWNPMRIEQRIGRIDRYGQESKYVRIVNLITPDTIDFEIYHRCLIRIGVFRRAIGGSEEILGNITRELGRLATGVELTDAERASLLERIADNAIRLEEESTRLEESQLELFGIRLPEQDFAGEVEAASSVWLQPWALQNLIESYLSQEFGGEHRFVQGTGPAKNLRLAREIRHGLLESFRNDKGSGTLTLEERDWQRWLKGSEPNLAITFESDAARDDASLTLVTPAHPLAQSTARGLSTPTVVAVALEAPSASHDPGSYDFVIYLWEVRGVRPDFLLQIVCEDDSIAEDLPHLMRKARDIDDTIQRGSPHQASADLERRHHALWQEARDHHRARTEDMARYRRESLRTSHEARMALLESQLAQATEERIRRMREAQVANAVHSYGEQMDELEDAGERADILYRPVAYGTITVVSEDG